MRQVAVTGLGAITPLGVGVKRSWKRLLEGKCGVVSLSDRGSTFQQLQCRVGGIVPLGKNEDGGWTTSEHLSRDDERRMVKFMQYATVAAKEALDDAGWHPQDPKDQERTGVAVGSGIGAFEDIYNTSLRFASQGPKKVSPLFVPRLLINLAAGHISMKYGFKGPNHAAATACTTGAHSIGDAARYISLGYADVMVAGGAESCIHPLAITGFERSRSLTTSSNESPGRASRPFSNDRDGFVIGEGAGVMVLEELDHALQRGAHVHAILSSDGVTSDAHHLTQPPGDGNGAYRAMRNALIRAELKPSDVDYINAHATSTPLGDAAENRAIASLMEGHCRNDNVCVSSTKGATGHLLGAAGAAEAIFSVLAIVNNIAPATLNLDPASMDRTKFCFNYVPNTPQERQIDVVLTNSFGFGGTNASLCFSRYRA